jgi:hypothetical protein
MDNKKNVGGKFWSALLGSGEGSVYCVFFPDFDIRSREGKKWRKKKKKKKKKKNKKKKHFSFFFFLFFFSSLSLFLSLLSFFFFCLGFFALFLFCSSLPSSRPPQMRLSPLVALAALAATSAAGGVAAESIESTCADCSRFVSTMVELSADRFTFAPATSDSDAAAPAGVHAAELARAVGAADVQLCAQLEGEFRNACVHVIETEGSLGPVQVLAATNPDAICAHLTSCFLAEAASVQATTTTVAAPATAFLAEAQGSRRCRRCRRGARHQRRRVDP